MDMERDNLCKLCSQRQSKYVCPRCNISYCSLPCYQTEDHRQCSESFYKDCVVEQMKINELDSQSQKSMTEILQRVQQIDDQFEENIIDSDDDSDVDDLASRLEGVDLDDADSIWEQLTAEERQKFEELLKSGDVSKVLPQWQPWWIHREKKNLVEDLEDSYCEETEPMTPCPPIKKDILPLCKLSKVTPSPTVRWNVVNVLAAYALTARIFNGDYESAALEAATILVSLSQNLSSNQLFDDPELAVSAVCLAAVNENGFGGDVDKTQLKDDVERLVGGPSETSQSQYVLAALSEIHRLFTAARRTSKGNNKTTAVGEFSKRFPNSSNAVSTTSMELKKYLKKIEFYLSWVKECF